jgi:HSP20 family protein
VPITGALSSVNFPGTGRLKISHEACCRQRVSTTKNPQGAFLMNELSTTDLMSLDPFDDAFRGFLRPWNRRGMETTPQIKVDLKESNGNYTLKAEIPGVSKDDIDVKVDDNKVTISAEVKKESEKKEEGRVLRSERHYGYASRSFWLDSPVDDAKVSAKYNNGVLELTLPKKKTSTSKRIAIS